MKLDKRLQLPQMQQSTKIVKTTLDFVLNQISIKKNVQIQEINQEENKFPDVNGVGLIKIKMLQKKLTPLKINKGTVINQESNFIRRTTVKYKTPELQTTKNISKNLINYGSQKVVRINEAKPLKDDKNYIPITTLKKIVIPKKNKSIPKKNKESISEQNFEKQRNKDKDLINQMKKDTLNIKTNNCIQTSLKIILDAKESNQDQNKTNKINDLSNNSIEYDSNNSDSCDEHGIWDDVEMNKVNMNINGTTDKEVDRFINIYKFRYETFPDQRVKISNKVLQGLAEDEIVQQNQLVEYMSRNKHRILKQDFSKNG